MLDCGREQKNQIKEMNCRGSRTGRKELSMLLTVSFVVSETVAELALADSRTKERTLSDDEVGTQLR